MPNKTTVPACTLKNYSVVGKNFRTKAEKRLKESTGQSKENKN